MSCAVLVCMKKKISCTVTGILKESTVMLLILSFGHVTLQFFVLNVYYCVLKYNKFKFYEKPVLTNYFFLLS